MLTFLKTLLEPDSSHFPLFPPVRYCKNPDACLELDSVQTILPHSRQLQMRAEEQGSLCSFRLWNQIHRFNFRWGFRDTDVRAVILISGPKPIASATSEVMLSVRLHYVWLHDSSAVSNVWVLWTVNQSSGLFVNLTHDWLNVLGGNSEKIWASFGFPHTCRRWTGR